MSIQILCWFVVIIFLFLSFESALCILKTIPLSDMWFALIFFYPVACLYSFNSVFWSLNFDEVQMMMMMMMVMITIIIFGVDHAFGIAAKSFLFMVFLYKFYNIVQIFSCPNFIILCFIFRSVLSLCIHIFFHMAVKLFWHHLLKSLYVLFWVSFASVSKINDHISVQWLLDTLNF